MLDHRGNKISGWSKGEKRGGKDYIPPLGWKDFGLNVLNKYDSGDNLWIRKNNSKGQWDVAYHGIGQGNDLKI